MSSAPDTAAEYQAAFDGLRNAGTGWLSADGSLPVNLPDGRILWLFGDTIRPGGSLDNNSFVVQDDNCFRPIFEPLPEPIPGHWLWPTAAVVEGTNLRMFALHMAPGSGSGPFNFQYVQMEIVTLTLPGLNFVSRQAVPIPTTGALPSYGETISVSNDGGTDYVYTYGRTTTGTGLGQVAHHYLARVPLGQVLTAAEWRVWDGAAWSSDPGMRAELNFDRDPNDATPPDPTAGPEAPFTVFGVTGGFLGSALSFDVLSDQLETWDASAPQGPFTFKALAVDIWPAPGDAPDGQFGYGGRVVFGIPGAPIALWSINHETLIDPSVYKARFETPAAASVP